MRDLPNAVTTVQNSRYLSPTAIANAGDCVLRIVLSAERAPRLTNHPAAELGGVLHQLLESSARGEVEGSPEKVRTKLNQLLRNAHSRLDLDPDTAGFADLSVAFGPLQWRNRLRLAIDAALRISTKSPVAASHKTTTDGEIKPPLSFVGTRAEVKLVSPALRLAGRVDLITRTSEAIEIVDLKSGRVLDHNGIRDAIVKQVRLYGLIVRSLEPTLAIKLTIDNGLEYSIPFEKTNEAQIRDELDRILEPIKEIGPKSAKDLARPGLSCSTCASRHICSSYLQWAPSQWSESLPYRLPLDAWGSVMSVVHTRVGVELMMEDAAGRTAKIFGLDAAKASKLQVGNYVYLFNLQSSDRVLGSRWRHPVNFFENSADAPLARAWQLSIFAQS